MKYDSNNHSVFLLQYHLIMCVKYRRKVIDGGISDALKGMFARICPGCHITLEEWNHDMDHVHVRRQYAEAVRNGGCASDCIACGQCERACPQQIDVITRLKDCAAQFDRV